MKSSFNPFFFLPSVNPKLSVTAIENNIFCASSGGVAANTLLRERLSDLTSNHDLNLAFPPLSLCTDNGVMIAWAAHEAIRSSSPPSALISKDEISALQISPRWPFGI